MPVPEREELTEDEMEQRLSDAINELEELSVEVFYVQFQPQSPYFDPYWLFSLFSSGSCGDGKDVTAMNTR